MSITLDAITLPEDMVWDNEFDYTPVQQSRQNTLTGAQIIDSGIKLSGRPIIMLGGADAAWIDRGNLKTLYAKLDDDASMTLTLDDGRTFPVRFDHQALPIFAKPITDFSNPVDADDYSLTLRLFTV